jgi:dihydroneopterin aldolase
MDKIFLSSLAVECIVGIWDWERRVKQTVIVDIEMAADIRKAAATDHIDNTIDYKKVSKRLQQFIGDSQFQLVETLTDRIAQVIVTEFGVPWVKVRLNKKGAIRGARDVGIEIERTREDYLSAAAPDRSPSAASAGAQERPPDRSPSAASAGAQERPPAE